MPALTIDGTTIPVQPGGSAHTSSSLVAPSRGYGQSLATARLEGRNRVVRVRLSTPWRERAETLGYEAVLRQLGPLDIGGLLAEGAIGEVLFALDNGDALELDDGSSLAVVTMVPQIERATVRDIRRIQDEDARYLRLDFELIVEGYA